MKIIRWNMEWLFQVLWI